MESLRDVKNISEGKYVHTYVHYVHTFMDSRVLVSEIKLYVYRSIEFEGMHFNLQELT